MALAGNLVGAITFGRHTADIASREL